MSRLFAYRTTSNTPQSGSKWLVVFSPQSMIPLGDLYDLLMEDIGVNLQPDVLVFLVRDNVAAKINTQLGELGAEDWRVPINTTTVVVVGFTQTGCLGNVYPVSGPDIRIDDATFATLQDRGLCELFHRRDGLVRPSETTHFVHPSGKHSKAFIRAANLLVLGPEVMFVAMTILDHLASDLEYICVDTSSIASVGHAAIQLRQLFDSNYVAPMVNSFSSWPGINGAYDFMQPKKTLALISASTSGNMARALVQRKMLLEDRVLILFGLIEHSSEVAVLCNLAGDPRYGDKLPLVTEEYRESDCPLCRAGSTPVHFVGDQFLADAIQHVGIKITGRDIEDDSKAFLGRYRCLGALGMRQQSNNATAVDTYFVDIIKLKGSVFDDRVKAASERHVAASTKLVVNAGDPGSAQLALEIAHQYAPKSVGTPLSAKDVDKVAPNSVHGSVLIVTGCIGSGGCLQSISRDLRDPAGDAPRTYLIGVAKHTQHSRHTSLRGDLVYSSTDYKHAVVIIEELTLPERHGPSAWEVEREALNGLIQPGSNAALDPDLVKAVTNRISAIDGLQGSVDSFFWAAPNGTPLGLRKTFAFWDGDYDPAKASHGDILFTIACVLENLRDGRSPRLHQTAFRHSFIAPSTFGRFNDGVIQSAFLRAAMLGELDYSGDEDASREMARLLKRIFGEWDRPRGEATVEFLISLMCGRMRLKGADLVDCLQELDGAPPLILALRAACEK
ncbi:hypothetical protein GFGA_1d1139 [Gluconobacter frateurii NBRC 103465]|nr:hypothetical protein GFGA_1d1139 [Gluconobacter frateurii NBRC 103465]